MLACSRAARGVQLANFAFVRKSRGRGLVGRARACDDSDASFNAHLTRFGLPRVVAKLIDEGSCLDTPTRRAAVFLHIMAERKGSAKRVVNSSGPAIVVAPCVGNK